MNDGTRQLDQHVPVATTGRSARVRLQSVRRGVQVGDLRMSVLDWSGPERPINPPAILLHGALQTAEGMANVASHLARRGRVIVPDLRGRGETAQPADGYDPGTMASDVAELIEQMEIDRPVIVGRLHGGLVAYHLASQYPQRISGLIIGDTLPEVTPKHAQHLVDATRALPRSFSGIQDAYAFYQRALGLPLERAVHDIPFDLVPRQGGYRWRYNLDLIARIEEAALPRSDWEILAKIVVPTLILRGQRGSLSDDMAARMCEEIGDCTVQMIMTSGRDVFVGAGAEQAFAAIDLFLLRLTDRGAVASPSEQARRNHARSFVEPLVRALNGRDMPAVHRLLGDSAKIDLVRDQQAMKIGDASVVDGLFSELGEQRPAAVFTVERFLASRSEASVLLAGRSTQAEAETADSSDDETIYINLWFTVTDGKIHTANVQISRVAP